MRKIFVKLILLALTLVLALSLAGCLFETDYSLESTSPSSVPTTSTAKPYVRTEFDSVKYPYYAMLSETEKNVYSQICEELNAGNSEFECLIEISADQLTRAIDAVLNDHPEFFWVDSTYGYSYDPKTGSIKDINFTFFDFADTPEKLEAAKAEVDSIVTSIMDKTFSYSSAVERELFIHDYICENTTYDINADYNQSAYSVLVLHKSVCAGYARCFQYLMQKAGIPCYYVTGRTDGLSSSVVGGSDADGSHSWNMVRLDGAFYNVDCLWDDTASETYGSLIYPFFNVTDEGLVYHARIDKALGLPQCTATEFKYSNQFGSTIEADSIVFADAA